jgi:hypothetical protein
VFFYSLFICGPLRFCPTLFSSSIPKLPFYCSYFTCLAGVILLYNKNTLYLFPVIVNGMTDKSISQRLFIKAGYRVALIGAPDNFIDQMGDLPERVIITRSVGKTTNIVQSFVDSKEKLIDFLDNLYKENTELIIWIAYPKAASKIKTNINRDSISIIALENYGMKSVAMISIDEAWASIRFKFI